MGSPALRDTSMKLTQRVYEATFHRDRIADGLWQFLGRAQEDFLAAAREELEILALAESAV